MNKSKNTKGNRKDLILIYRMAFRYWYYLISGLIAMFLYAFFNGISITLIIPLLDYVFNPHKPAILYQNMPAFWQALGDAWRGFATLHGGLLSQHSLNDFAPLWKSVRDIMLQTDSFSLLYAICIFVIASITLKNVFLYIQKVLFINLRGNTIRDVRNRMFSQYMSQSLEFHSQHQTGDAIVRMVNDVEIVSEQFIRSILEGLRDLVTILVYMRIAILLNSSLFVYSVIVLPVFVLTMGYLGRKIRKYSRRIQAQLSSMFSAAEEAMNSMKIIKAFGREESETENFKGINKTHLRLWKRSQAYSAMSLPISEISSAITGVVVIIIGGKMILTPGSTFSVGDFTAFLFALFSMLHPLKTLSQLYTDVRKALVSLGRISLVLNQHSSIQDARDAVLKTGFDSTIVFDNVSFCYRNRKPVLDNVSLTISKGEKIAFVGASGGGKTTLANLLNRMYDVSEGSIQIDGIDIRNIKILSLRKLFGVVTQDSVLFTRSIRDNIAFGVADSISNDEIAVAARIAHCEEFIDNFPDKFDEILQIKGSNLSGGQRQRLCIARAIVGNPPILVFDEATSALDTESEKLVQQAIDNATKNRTVILIAHRLSTVRNADRIFVLEHGKIVGVGKHEELLVSCPRYQHLHSIQSGEG
jgi:ATP-binding cassette, subfamily B, bacterial MsbA